MSSSKSTLTGKPGLAKPKASSRRGRNPSIDMEMIENAVLKVSNQSNDLSMKEVAEELGVNVTTLYRYIGGIDGLRRVRATLSRAVLDPIPSPEGRTWPSWMRILADYYRSALLEHPDLLDFVQAALDPDFLKLEEEASILVKFGFEPRAALLAHSYLITTITGYVHQELQTIEDTNSGFAPYYARLFQNLDAYPDRLPTLRSVNLSQRDLDRDLNFKAVISYAIAGIGAQAGSPSEESDTVF